jgi:hypothetical protein
MPVRTSFTSNDQNGFSQNLALTSKRSPFKKFGLVDFKASAHPHSSRSRDFTSRKLLSASGATKTSDPFPLRDFERDLSITVFHRGQSEEASHRPTT